MPITAVLSRTLHEALGPEAAADLVDWMQTVDTHRVELRELNELSYARLDARINELRHDIRAEFSGVSAEFVSVRSEMHGGFAEMKIAIAGLEARMERRFSDLVKWSFLFWCGAVAAAALARV